MSLQEAVVALRKGNFIILIDHEKRENEGDLVLAAEKLTPEKLNGLLTIARGVLCVPLTAARVNELNIPMMVSSSTDKFFTPFTVSVDHRSTKTGVSVNDRITTIRALIHPHSTSDDFLRPGHVFPLREHQKGLKGRQGHTEASLELMRRASLYPAAIIAEIMDEKGNMANISYLKKIGKKYKAPLVFIDELMAHE